MRRGLLFASILLLGLAVFAAPAGAAIFTVDSTLDVNDGGAPNNGCEAAGGDECTLREAILAANLGDPQDDIEFSIAGVGPYTIQPASPLPAFTDFDTHVEGETEPQYAGTPVIELDGQLAGVGADGLSFTGIAGEVRGLVINRFSDDGVQFTGNAGSVQSSYIGTDVTGTIDRGNGNVGVEVTDSTAQVGGTGAGDGNLISGNEYAGIRYDDPVGVPQFNGGNVFANKIGTDVTGTLPLGNGMVGIDSGVAPANGDVAVDDTFGPEQVIAFNGPLGGILATGRTQIRGNDIFGNAGLGIDLGGDGVTANDPDDTDAGPNELLNTPVIDSVVTDGTDLLVTGTMDLPVTTVSFVAVSLYANEECDPSGSGEGERFLGGPIAASEVPGETDNYNFAAEISGAAVDEGDLITATTLDAGVGTSEFSQCYEAKSEPTVGEDVQAGPVKGTILYKPPGAPDFLELDEQSSLPEGTIIDATDGEVRIISEAPTEPGGLREGIFSRGRFKVLQDDTDPYILEARLNGEQHAGPRSAPPAESVSSRS